MTDESDPITLRGISITSADRVVFPDAGLTKGDIARHYDRVAERLLDTAADHPVSLVRCPSGLSDGCFYQKHAAKGWPAEMPTLPIREASGDVEDYLCLSDSASLLAAVQMGTVEFHVWGASRDRLERPDRMVFDLDPDEGLGFDHVREAALEIRAVLEKARLPCVPMVTGGKGVHVVVPLRRTADWDGVKGFAKRLATGLSDRAPDRFTATMSKDKRIGRVFIDWLRNERGATAIAPYALRARPGAPVAVPVTWDEFSDLDAPNGFHADDMNNRLSRPCPLAETGLGTLGKTAQAALDRWIGE
jgi:bifunctional non-homologous end joining protein LigD